MIPGFDFAETGNRARLQVRKDHRYVQKVDVVRNQD
jgi:hypothetical protein